MSKIAIQPVNVFTPTGIKQADAFEVRYVNYNPADGSARADAHLWSGDVEINSFLVDATPEQAAAWGNDDATFFKAIARNAGLTPV